MGGNREKLAVWQLHPGRCRREEGGAQPRPLVTRCHLLLPRRRLAQTMAARWRGGPGQPQSLASADTYCPGPTLRLPNLGALYWGWSLYHLLHMPSPPVICRAPSLFSTQCWRQLLRFLLASLHCPPPSNFRTCLSMCKTVLTTEWAVCGGAGTPLFFFFNALWKVPGT